MTLSRREFLGTSAAVTATGLRAQQGAPRFAPARSPRFSPVPLEGNIQLGEIAAAGVSQTMGAAASRAPSGTIVSWGIPFDVGKVIMLRDDPVTERFDARRSQWVVFMHTTDIEPLDWNEDGFLSPTHGEGRLPEHIADYVLLYADGSESRAAIRRRHQIGMLQRTWGENCFQAVAQAHPRPIRSLSEQRPAPGGRAYNWGFAEMRVAVGDHALWNNWLWAWEHPHPEKEIVGLRLEPKAGTIVLSGVSSGSATSCPFRWGTRKKAILELPRGTSFDYTLDAQGQMKLIRLDMGQIISAQPVKRYPNDSWEHTYNNAVPEISRSEVQIEYAAHPDATFYLQGERTITVSDLESAPSTGATLHKTSLSTVAPSRRRVRFRIIDRATGKTVPAKLHVHGSSGEYLAPVDRHRIPNGAFFEDYCAEFQNQGRHFCSYVSGETWIDLPLGDVYAEVSKGFEVRPIRRKLIVGADTETITLELEKVLPWRECNWVTGDTHVHFLSPATARLEGSAEGVNVINLLASQWGELMTNVGDFDGRTTFGSRESGGDGEWLVRVGTENRQHVLGHISLLGYSGNLISPMCSGGPAESAIGDPVDVLLMEWARQCRSQGGLVVLPHFPNPRCENAADLVSGDIDAVEMTSMGHLYRGIDPYSLSDYYRYLNCGYFVPVVGGTDKMSARNAVGTIRTYAKIPGETEFTYRSWIEAVRSGNTFVTYGPLMEFTVDGRIPGSSISMTTAGGTVDVAWELASVTVPMSRVDLIINGEIRESRTVDPYEDSGHWSVQVERSSWLALLVRGHYDDKTEMIAAHSSPVMIRVAGSEFHSAADAVTILEQIEGALIFLDTLGTRAEDHVYRRMRLKMTAAYRKIHNELHQRGVFHEHVADEPHGSSQ